ncbi:16847_t:CDS:2, partial [Cetraspora pellucida]
PESQAIFKRNEYYSVGEKIIPDYYAEKTKLKITVVTSTYLTIDDKVLDSNKCSLKVSLVGILQGTLTKIKDIENSIIETLIYDYISLPIDYTIK